VERHRDDDVRPHQTQIVSPPRHRDRGGRDRALVPCGRLKAALQAPVATHSPTPRATDRYRVYGRREPVVRGASARRAGRRRDAPNWTPQAWPGWKALSGASEDRLTGGTRFSDLSGTGPGPPSSSQHNAPKHRTRTHPPARPPLYAMPTPAQRGPPGPQPGSSHRRAPPICSDRRSPRQVDTAYAVRATPARGCEPGSAAR
jgi:hypothetical protein